MASQGKGTFGRVVAVLALVVSSAGATQKNARKDGAIEPSTRITLASIGVPVPSVNLLKQGMSLLTVDVIDDTHLLVTFATRDLVPRIEGDPLTDEDRILGGEVVELPSGKVLAKTKWHVHDQSRYLWPLGHGRFVLRIRDELSMFEPGHDLQGPGAFQRVAVPHGRGMPVGLIAAMNGEIVSVITQEPAPKQEGVKVSLGDSGDNQPKPVYDITYLRIKPGSSASEMATMEPAGGFRADIPLVVPMDGDGYLWDEESSHRHGEWAVTFNGFDGKVHPGGTLDSTCIPKLKMASRSEYVAFTCRGGMDGQTLRSMGLDGHETWEEDFGGFDEAPAFVFAPAASRFAMSVLRTTTEPGELNTTGNITGTTPAPSETNQEVRVYQNASGDLLARVALSPTFRVPENFDLSPDGRVLVTVQDDAINVFSLPALSKVDEQDIAEVMAFAPPVTTAEKVSFPRLFEAGSTKAAETASATAKQALSAPVSTTTQAPLPTTTTVAEGDGDSSGPRTRPTLLKPGEKPEFKDKATTQVQ